MMFRTLASPSSFAFHPIPFVKRQRQPFVIRSDEADSSPVVSELKRETRIPCFSSIPRARLRVLPRETAGYESADEGTTVETLALHLLTFANLPYLLTQNFDKREKFVATFLISKT